MSLHRSSPSGQGQRSAPEEPRARRWRRPLIATAALALAGAGVVAVTTNASAATFNQEGWSTMSGGTNGGGSGPVVTVTSLSAFTSAVGSSTQQTVNLNGHFTCSTEITVAS